MLFRTKRFFLKLTLVFAGIVFCGFGVSWIFKHIQEKRENMDVVRAQEEIMAEKVQQKNALEKEHNFVLEKEGMLQDVFLDEGSIVATIERLESLAQKANISVEIDILDDSGKKQSPKKKNTEKTENKNDQNKVTFLVKTTGTYEKTVAYLELLERMRPVASFEGVTMKRNDAQVFQGQETVSSEGSGEVPEVQKKEVVSEFTVSFPKSLDSKS